MNDNIIRTYIDQHGPITVTHQSGKTLTVVESIEYVSDWAIKESTEQYPIHVGEREHGFIVHRGEGHTHEGFYVFDQVVFDALNNIKLKIEFEYELRKLLPATIAQVDYYENAIWPTGRSSTVSEGINVRVYGLKDYTFKQGARGNVFVCPIETTGYTTDGHRIQGYMYSCHDNTIKFDSIQAWRMRELSRDELIAFDPKWGELVTP
ncbi:hypothetical protein ST201phi2-1p447 [Pseudomonas phage 201phi2-1]|uniref:Uncharacterized protein n=1 Tax=Pseudomonas phage 201phi2-1 TaxID=198110 RepID=B3FJV5_BP201|nr:hypothetical protein ST201phi2-1p447 [Pseudomonas phage 201phi2-1]ABY63270.1 hypothetical protein 201phi2-1p447 [Pseudomonas phage 201phi2-1]